MDEVLRVTALGEFIWHPEADRLIEEGDFSGSPAMPFILKALRRKEWIGLTDEERLRCFDDIDWNKVDWCPDHEQYAKAIEAKLKEKNG